MVCGVLVAAVAALLLTGSPTALAQPPAPPAPKIPSPVQPANVGDLKRDAVAYCDSGYAGYERLIMEPTGAQYVSAADFKAPQRAQIQAHPLGVTWSTR